MDFDILVVDGLIAESLPFFDEKQYDKAIEKLLDALEAITNKSTLIRRQILIQSWLGYCYFKQSKRTKKADEEEKLLERAVEHNQKWLKLANKKRTSNNKSMPNFVLELVILYRLRKPKIQPKGNHFSNRQVNVF